MLVHIQCVWHCNLPSAQQGVKIRFFKGDSSNVSSQKEDVQMMVGCANKIQILKIKYTLLKTVIY